MSPLQTKEKGIPNKRKKKAFCTSLKRRHKTLNYKRNVPVTYEDESLALSERDSRFFISVMENLPAPSEALLSIFE
ncbi:hypothetical protein [Argonema antarcticum]|uniref:hypothetical protein n=1 Tax=Argonema antarcticum TaxID=2942763 RepID=UPI002011B06B|nr:hypothetical protein [Argonema antarcticum]MCL1471631.1 hypothetical protein [Argonema antarcticum A004/B2]